MLPAERERPVLHEDSSEELADQHGIAADIPAWLKADAGIKGILIPGSISVVQQLLAAGLVAWLAGYAARTAHAGAAQDGTAPTSPRAVARQIVRVVGLPHGHRPFRVHVDPSQDGAEVVNAVADRMRREMYTAIGLADLLSPRG